MRNTFDRGVGRYQSNSPVVLHCLDVLAKRRTKVDLLHAALNYGIEMLDLGNITLKEKQCQVLKLLVVEQKDVFVTDWLWQIYQLRPPVCKI